MNYKRLAVVTLPVAFYFLLVAVSAVADIHMSKWNNNPWVMGLVLYYFSLIAGMVIYILLPMLGDVVKGLWKWLHQPPKTER